ncbi:MAG: DUF3857 domain-containing protein [Lacibacter sp.]
MRNLLTVLFIFIQQIVFSQGLLTYSSLTIPDSLKKDADAVFRLDEMNISIQSPSKMSIREHRIVTVLTKTGLEHSKINIHVDKMKKLDEVSVKVYNDLGFEIKTYKKKDFALEGMLSETTLASDDKMYNLSFPVPGLPCTIEVDYTVNYSGYVDLPEWYFGNTKESLMTSRYTISTNSSNQIKYKAYNTSIEPVITTANENKVYTWEIKNQPVLKNEPGSAGRSVYIPRIDVSPLYFNYDGYPGTMANWVDFGKWRFPFYTEENPFTEKEMDFFKSLVKDAATEEEKIGILYKYMQKETRYVFIAYGIGGLKPFPASFVEKKKYGDCKALSNYMKHILSAVGIKSYTASIYAGKDYIPFDPLFISNKSNHIIVCVPLRKDSVWLECTSKLTAPGKLGPFTENRNALLITENGGVLVNTPVSKSSDNKWLAKTNVELFDDGSALVKSRIFVSGEFWEYIYGYTDSKSKDDTKKALVNAFGYKAPDEYELKIVSDSADGHVVQLNMGYRQFFDFKAGAKHFFPLRQYKLNDETIKPAETRKFEYLFDFPYVKSDSTFYKLPGNFKKENLPSLKEIKNTFVFYKNEVQINETGDELKVITQLTLNKHVIPALQYNEVATSFELIKKDEGQKIVLKKE